MSIFTSSLVMSVTISWSIALFRTSPAFIPVVSVSKFSCIFQLTYKFVCSLYADILLLNDASLALENSPFSPTAAIVIPDKTRSTIIVITNAIKVIPFVS